MEYDKEQLQLLREIRENKLQQLSVQSESLEAQKKQFELYSSQLKQVEKLQDRAEEIQQRSSDLVEKSRKLLTLLLPNPTDISHLHYLGFHQIIKS